MKMIKERNYIYVCIIFFYICFLFNFNIVNASTAKYAHAYSKIFLENIDSESTYKIQFSMEDSFTSDEHYEILTISYKNGKILDVVKKDCGLLYSYSNNYHENHEYDIAEKTKVQKDGNIIVLSIEDLNGNEIGTYNTLTIFKNDVEILKFKDDDYFCDRSLTTCNDDYNVYTYSNIKIDLNQNKVEVLRENKVETLTKNNTMPIIIFTFILLIIIMILIVIKRKKYKAK